MRHLVLFCQIPERYGEYCTDQEGESIINHEPFWKLIFNESDYNKLCDKRENKIFKLKIDVLRVVSDYFICEPKKDSNFDLDSEGLNIFEFDQVTQKYIYIDLLPME